jgi:hypothetical protein
MYFPAFPLSACLLLALNLSAQATPDPGKGHKPNTTPVTAAKKASTASPAVEPGQQPVAVSESFTFTGVVVDVNGNALPGATLWLNTEGGTSVVVSNAKGKFALPLPNARPIVLNCGYAGLREQKINLDQPKRQNGLQVMLVQGSNK